MQATGEFEVDLQPLEASLEDAEGMRLGRMSIAKAFHGDLAGQSRGEMLTAMTPTEGSAGYVALEQVRGTLNGRSGTFLLQHFGIMNRGEHRLVLEVVPDSGTEALEGLSGSMIIRIEDGRHRYQLEYSLDGS
ncbi:MAG: DUF3224 domain-containing protein [Candidatus Promineifilaceae bacterium]|nr:DUF3224 domain-containing protein [Candidatus Promineifilaceae bacterium]